MTLNHNGHGQYSAAHLPAYHSVGWRDMAGAAHMERTPRPNYDLGDVLYFPDGIPNGWMLRPALQTDVPIGRTLRPDAMLLLRKWPAVVTFYTPVCLPFQMRKNTRFNVQRALRKVVRAEPALLEFIERSDRLQKEREQGL